MYIESQNEVVIGNSAPGQTFKIAASAKAFKILSSNIYKNKIRAVVRELVCNAYDIHTLYNPNEPFLITAPNEFDCRFIIRDRGIGMCEEDIYGIYAGYFETTKDQRNDQIGAFGLGSKSPFSYTDTFSVISRYEGVTKIYTAILVNGEPQITKTFEDAMQPGEHAGLEVFVPVKEKDIDTWHNEIAYIMRPFKKSSYEIHGAPIDVKAFEDLENYSATEWFGANRHCGELQNKNVYAVYGNIVYPLDDVPGLKKTWMQHKAWACYIHFPLGSLDIQPSREELSLDERTITNIIARVESLDVAYIKDTVAHLNSINSRRQLARELYQYGDDQLKILESRGCIFGDGSVTLKDMPSIDFADLSTKMISNNIRFKWISSFSEIKNQRIVPLRTKSYTRLKVSEVCVSEVYKYNVTQAFILIDDMKGKYINATIKGLLDSESHELSKNNYIAIIRDEIPSHVAMIDEIKAIMETDEVIVYRASELEEVRKTVSTYKMPKTERVKVVRPSSPNACKYTVVNDKWACQDQYMTSSEVEEIDGYVVGIYGIDQVRALCTVFGMVTGDHLEFREMAKRFGVTEIYQVRPVIYKKILSAGKAKCLINFLIEKYIELHAQNNAAFRELNDDSYSSNVIKYTRSHRVEKLIAHFGLTSNVTTSKFVEIISNTNVYGDTYNWVNGYKFADVKAEYAKTQEELTKALRDKLKQFREASPILYYVMDHKYYMNDAELADIKKLLENIEL